MGSICLVIFFVVYFCSQQCFAEEEPVFPTYSGDYRVGGYMIVEDLPEIRITFWWSEANKAIRQDFKSPMGSRKRLQLERDGKYGKEVLISKDSDGNRECTSKEGTDENPITYRPFFDGQGNRTFLGTKSEGGLVIHKWLTDTHGFKQVVFMKETENGLIPYRIEVRDITLLILHFSKQYIPPYLFAYNQNTCKEDVTKKIIPIEHLVKL